MFDADPILWLQSWATPVLTGVMNAVSLLGYTRAYVAFAIWLAFGFRQRAALALLVLLALNAAFTDAAKAAVEAPRPDWDQRVQALSIFAQDLREQRPDTPTENEDSYGFPSGHVSAATAVGVGAALLVSWRWRWAAAIVWIVAMAASRLYLGRHFIGDALGGVAVGLGAVALGFGALKLENLAASHEDPDARRPAHRTMIAALSLAGVALLLGLPDTGDAGRLLGVALGLLAVAARNPIAYATTRRMRVLLVVVAAASFGAAWLAMEQLLAHAEPSSVSALRLAATTLPYAAMLAVPAFAAAPLAGRAARP